MGRQMLHAPIQIACGHVIAHTHLGKYSTHGYVERLAHLDDDASNVCAVSSVKVGRTPLFSTTLGEGASKD